MSSGPPQRRSIVISRTTFLDISGADYDGEIFTFSVKKDDFSWFIKKHYSELDFFRKTILEQSSKFSEKFPSPEEFSDHKEMLLEMTAWIKDCGEVLHSSAMLNQMFFAFLKVNDNALK